MEKTARDWSKVKRIKAPFHINIRLTAEENERLQTSADNLGVSKAGFVKSAALGRPIPRASRRPNAVAGDLRQLLGLLGKLGSNANQIARVCNSGTLTDYQQAAANLQGIERELSEMRALLLTALNVEP